MLSSGQVANTPVLPCGGDVDALPPLVGALPAMTLPPGAFETEPVCCGPASICRMLPLPACCSVSSSAGAVLVACGPGTLGTHLGYRSQLTHHSQRINTYAR